MPYNQLQMPPKDTIRVKAERLRKLVSQIFQRLNVPAEDADIAADVLVTADLQGVESHGVSNYMKNIYVPNLLSQQINPCPNIRTVKTTGATALIDGDGGLGQVVAYRAMELAIEKARNAGAGMVAVTNSRHFGAAGYYSAMAAQEDMIGLAMTNAEPHVVPTLGQESRLGTNPISIAAPSLKEPTFLLDMATCVAAMGKVHIANRLGTTIPKGWAFDKDNHVTQDPSAASEAKRAIPLGGLDESQGSHKGYGLAVAVDIFSGILSGIGYGGVLPHRQVGHFFGALDISAYRSVDAFKLMMDDMFKSLRATPPATENDRVQVAGEPEAKAFKDRSARGIPLHCQVVQYLEETAQELGIEYRLEGTWEMANQ